MNNGLLVGDDLSAAMERGRGHKSLMLLKGRVRAEMIDEDGNVKSVVVGNLITAVGDQMYAARGAGVGSAPAAPTGMKLGTGSTAPAKTGAGAALVTYLAGSNRAFDATYPQASGGVVTYRRTFAPGEATTASAITEAVIVNDTIGTDATSTAANTISRALITGVGSKAAGDTLVLTWTHTLLGA